MITDQELREVLRAAIAEISPTLDLSNEKLKEAPEAINRVKVEDGKVVWPTDYVMVLLEHGDNEISAQAFKSRVEKKMGVVIDNAIAEVGLF